MSTVRSNTYQDASGGSNAQLYGVASPPNSMGFRNRILNGGMVIDQRNAGAAVTGQQYVVDRWRTWFDTGTYSFQQITDAPTGFTNSLRVTKTNTTQSNYAFLVQYIEGLNCADFAWGSASAQTVTISFWVKSSITGAFTVALSNSAENRFYGTTYTINAANTWEQKSVTIAGDTSGTWLTTNGIGIQVMFNFGQAATAQAANTWTTSSNARAVTGSTSLGTTNNATWQITGVQLEAGTVASPFERRDYGRELMMCQRYYYKTQGSGTGSTTMAIGFNTLTTATSALTYFPVTLRDRPTALEQSGTAADYLIAHGNTSTACSAVPTFGAGTSKDSGLTAFTVASGLTAGQGARAASASGNTSAYLAWSAEL